MNFVANIIVIIMMSTTTSNSTPTMYYKLESMKSQDILDEINTYTNNFENKGLNYSDEFISSLHNKLQDTDKCFQKGFLYSPKNSDITKQVIGKEGYYFHLTTSKCNVIFIWHDRKVNKFLFWGDKWNVIKAMNIIKSRINIVTDRMKQQGS